MGYRSTVRGAVSVMLAAALGVGVAGLTPAAQAATTSVGASAVDPFDRASVVSALQNEWIASQELINSSTWNGDAAACKAGSTPAAVQQAAAKQINFVRGLVGAMPAALDSSNTEQQAGALLVHVNKSTSHSQPQSAKCWTTTGNNGLGASLLAQSFYPDSAIGAFLDDAGSGNKDVGHRRFLLDRNLGSVAVGVAGEGWAVRPDILGRPDANQPGYNPISAWPNPGYAPQTVYPAVSNRWSLTTAIGAGEVSLSRATVKVTKLFGHMVAGKDTPVGVAIDEQSGSSLVFKLIGSGSSKGHSGRDVTFRVEVSNLYDDYGKRVPDYVYTTTSFDPTRTLTDWTLKPQLNGRPEVNKPYTVTAGQNEVSSSNPLSFITYDWLVDQDIVSQGESFTPTVEHAGKKLSVRATIRDVMTGHTLAAATVNAPYVVYQEKAPTSLNPPTIAGSGIVGQTLTATPGTWSGTLTNTTYQWFRGGAPIPGATAATYKVQTTDSESQIRVQVTGHGIEGYTTAAMSEAINIARDEYAYKNPEVIGLPVITGTAQVNQTLKVSSGTWTNAGSFEYQWLRNGSDIPRATGTSRKLTADDVNAKITVRVTARSLGGYTIATTAAVGPVTSAPVTPEPPAPPAPPKPKALKLTGKAKISGTVKVGKTLTAKKPKVNASGVKVTYRWYRAGKAISGATKAKYKLTKKDVKKSIKVKLVFAKAGYTKASSTSAAVKPKK